MAMLMRQTASLTGVCKVGLRVGSRLFCTALNSSLPFSSPLTNGEQSVNKRPQNDPSTNLFISGLNKRTTSDKLREFAEQFGQVVSAKVVTDRVSQYSKGFGFVDYVSLEDAAKGIEGMDGKFLDGWVIFAEYARPRQFSQRPEFPQDNSAPYQSRRY